MSGKKITDFLMSKEKKSNPTATPQVQNEEIQDFCHSSTVKEVAHDRYKQFRPPANFNFPKTKIGQRERSCHYHWFQKYEWLHYEERYNQIFILYIFPNSSFQNFSIIHDN